MKYLFPFLFSLLPTLTNAQKIHIAVPNQSDTTVYLLKYIGGKLQYADTARMVHGEVTFDGSGQKQGIYGLLLPERRFFELIYDGKDVDMTTQLPDFIDAMKSDNSLENQVFYDYIRFLRKSKKISDPLREEITKFAENSPERKSVQQKIDAVAESVQHYQDSVAKKYADLLVGKFIHMAVNIDTKHDKNGHEIDSADRYYYYRNHYFDNIDLKDDRLSNTKMFTDKVNYFFSPSLMVQNPDTIARITMGILDQLSPNSDNFKYILTRVMSQAENSQVMGMDKLFVLLGKKYYCDVPADKIPTWMNRAKLNDLCGKMDIWESLLIGKKAIDIKLPDTTEKQWKDLYSMKGDYTILYFWEPWCSHCKKETPILEELYEKKLKARNVSIYGVATATGEDLNSWKAFIRQHHLTFTNVALTDSIFRMVMDNKIDSLVPKYTTKESLNYSKTYDISGTPTIFILDKDKKIIAKNITLTKVEEFLDEKQGHEKAPKIVPILEKTANE